MIYLAGILILLGSFILLFTFFQETKPTSEMKTKKKSFPQQKTSSNFEFKKRKSYSFASSENSNHTETDVRIRKERELFPKEETMITDQSPVLERIFADDVEYAELVQEGEDSENSQSTPMVQVKGILFLDYARKIPENLKKNSYEKWKEDAFLHFKRIGFAELQENSGIVQFHIPQQIVYKLIFDEVEQILFYKNAFTLIPQNQALPIAVFFTDQIDIFKEYVSKKYSSIENYIKQ